MHHSKQHVLSRLNVTFNGNQAIWYESTKNFVPYIYRYNTAPIMFFALFKGIRRIYELCALVFSIRASKGKPEVCQTLESCASNFFVIAIFSSILGYPVFLIDYYQTRQNEVLSCVVIYNI